MSPALLDWIVHPRFVGYKSALVAARLAFKVDNARQRYFDCVRAMHLSVSPDPWNFCVRGQPYGWDAGWAHLVTGRTWLALPQKGKLSGRLRRGAWKHVTVTVRTSTFCAAAVEDASDDTEC